MNVASPHERELARRTKPNPIDGRAAAYDVIDTDFHFVPDWDALRRYMPEPFRTELNRYPLVGSAGRAWAREHGGRRAESAG
jgi:hypothetical protein